MVIVAGKRTPIGTFLGGLSNHTAPALGTAALTGAISASHIEPTDIEEVYVGNVINAGAGQAPARQVALGAHCKKDTPSTTINKVCASGMKSIMMAAQAIAAGDRSIMAAGGMESMSRIPHYANIRKATPYANSQLIDGLAFDGLTDVYNNIPMGSCVEKTNSEMGITREAQDEFAIASYNRARQAQSDGVFDWEIVDIKEVVKGTEKSIHLDEECQKFMPDKFPALRPAFAKNGSITPANASKINDGASAVILMAEETAKERGLKPLARIIAHDDAAVDPIDFAIAPSSATQKLLKKAGMSMKDIEYHEINEAFSAVVLANMKLLDLDHERVNVHGGAVALGHPIGMSGNRIVLSLLNVLRAKGATLGMASICNGGGGASAMILERLN